MIEVIRFRFDDKEFLKESLEIRRKVFVEEQQVDPDLEFDKFEIMAQHYLMKFNGIPVGVARWRETDNGIKLERFAVLKEYRNKRLGERLLERVLDDVMLLSKTIYLHSQLKAVSFYQRAGFIAKGDIFEEAGIQHYYMEFQK